MKIFPSIYNVTFSAAAVLLLSGFSSVHVADIETAVIEKDFKAAKQLATDYIAQNPKGEDVDQARYYLGLSKLYLKEYAAARAILEALVTNLTAGRWKDNAALGIIDSFYMEGHYQVALEKAQTLLKEKKDSEILSLIYLKIARANMRLARWKEARVYLDKIAKTFPDSLESHAAKQLLEEKQFFAVQVGSFLDRGRADTLVQKLLNQNEYAYIVETIDKSGAKFYRVRVGQLSRLEEAEKLDQKLSENGYPTRIYP